MDMEMSGVQFALIYSGAFYELVDSDAPLPPGACVRVPCPSFYDLTVVREEAPAAEATEAPCTCY